MPGIESCSVDKHLTSLYKLHKKGLKAVAIFPVVTKSKKSLTHLRRLIVWALCRNL